MTVNNLLRDYRVFRPPTLDTTQPMPLVILLHGSPIDAAGMEGVIHVDAQATAGGFLSVFPDGCSMDWDQRHGSIDVDFISHMVDRLEAEYSIDRSRVYLVGSSAGGFMAYRLACDLADRFAAMASVAGSMWWDDCRPARPIPILEMHGTSDANVPYDGGPSTYHGQAMPPVMTVIQRWVGYDGCTGEPVPSLAGITRTSLWNRCGGGSVVRLDTVIGGHHTWFGSTFDPVPGEPDSNHVVWDFLKQFRLAA
jgi:polyhydroxybutyrate depolymerase